MKAVFTGGGSAGHVIPNIPIINALRRKGWDVDYIGSENGQEKEIIRPLGIPFHGISSGKLRRYLSLENLKDIFRVLAGIVQSIRLLGRIKPDVVFSKGGFVAFPVAVAGWVRRVPVIIHESDLTPGLANRLCQPFSRRICVSFDETAGYIKRKDKIVYSGNPLRPEFSSASAERAIQRLGLKPDKPILLVFGGGQGSTVINDAILAILPTLTSRFQVIHGCGKGKVPDVKTEDYYPFEFIREEFYDILAAASLVVSRSGANTVYEVLSMKTPHLFIPLSKKASRGDQIHNARYFEKKGYSVVIDEDQLTPTLLLEKIEFIRTKEQDIRTKLNQFDVKNSVDIIVQLIEDMARLHASKG